MVSSISSDNAVFTVSPASVTLTPAQTRTVTVTFSPTAAGAQGASVTVVSDDSDEPSLTVAASGNGLAAAAPVIVAAAPEITLSTSLIDLGTVITGNSVTYDFTVGNTGSNLLNVSSMTVDNSDLSLSSTSLSIPAGQSRTVTLTFSPVNVGSYSATITINSNDSDEGTIRLPVHGECAPLSAPLSAPELQVSKFVLDLGAVEIGGTASSSFYISNIGNEDLVVSSISAGSAEFSVTPESVTIPPGGKQDIIVSFKPDGQGLFNSSIMITNNDSDEGSRSIKVSGVGFEQIENPAVSFSVESVEIQADSTITNGSTTFYIKNTTADLLNIDRVFSDLPEVIISYSSAEILPGDSSEITVTIASDNPGIYQALISVAASTISVGMQTLTIELFAWLEKSEPEILVETLSLNLGAVVIGQTKTEFIEISNAGRAELNVELQFQDRFTAFSTAREKLTLAPGAIDSIEIIFSPDSVSGYEATLEIISNDSDNGKLAVTLSGTGIPLPEPEIALACIPDFIDLSLAAVRDLGQFTPESSVEFAFIISNDGNDVLRVVSIETDSDYFSAPQGSFEIQPGRYQECKIVFQSAQTGEFSTTVLISSNDNDESSSSFTLSATVIPEPCICPEPVLWADEIQFGEIVAGDSTSRILYVKIPCKEHVELNSYITGSASFTVAPSSQRVAASDSCRIEVLFLPDSSGVFSGTLNISGDCCEDNCIEIKLSGHGIAIPSPILEVSKSSIVFGSVPVGSPATAELVLTNSGSDVLRIYKVATSNEEFSVANVPDSIAVGDTFSILITFAPSTDGEKTGNLVISSNDPASAEKQIELTAAAAYESQPNIQLDTRELRINDFDIGSGASTTILISNTGDSELIINKIVATDPHLLIEPVSAVIKPGQDLEVTVALTVSLSGTYQEQLHILSNDSDEDTLVINISFRAVLPADQGLLQQNFPNPFNPSTTIKYSVASQTRVSLSIYDVRGRLIRSLVNRTHQPGAYSLNWDGLDKAGRPVSSGVYFYRMKSAKYEQTRKMMILK